MESKAKMGKMKKGPSPARPAAKKAPSPARPAMKKKMGPALTKEEAHKPSASSTLALPSAPVRMVRRVSPGKNKQFNEYNQKMVQQIKGPSIDLRATGADPETDPTLELGILMDCTSSMHSWIQKAKETIKEIIDKVIKECEEDGSLKCRVSFVGYRDIGD